MSQPSITKISLEITCLKFHSNFPGANELTIIVPLKTHLSSLSQLPLTSSVFPSFHLQPVPAGIIYLHAVPSVVLLQCHKSVAVPSILPLRHPSYTIRPSPSVHHRPSVTPSMQPLEPSVPSPRHPPTASSLCPSGAQLKWIWPEVSWISLISSLNDRHLYKKIINSKICVIYWEMSHVYFTGKGTISMLNPFKLFWVFRAGLRMNYQNHCPSILQCFIWSWL